VDVQHTRILLLPHLSATEVEQLGIALSVLSLLRHWWLVRQRAAIAADCIFPFARCTVARATTMDTSSASSLGAKPPSILMISVVQVPIQTITLGLRSRLIAQSLQLVIIIQLSGNISFFQFLHSGVQQNHHPHSVL